MNLTNEARQFIGMGERNNTKNQGMMGEFMPSDWLMIRRGGTKRLPNCTLSAESTDEIPPEISRQFAMSCTIQFAVYKRGTSVQFVMNRGRPAFRRLYCLHISLPLPARRLIQDVKSGGMSL